MAHAGLGMCNQCYRSRASRMRATVRKHAMPKPEEPTFRDTVKMARDALLPSLQALAAKGSSCNAGMRVNTSRQSESWIR